MKKTKLLALILAFLMLITSAGVFAEDQTQENTQTSYQLSAEAKLLRDNIAQVLADVEDDWTAFDMALYQKVSEADYCMTDSAKQAAINSCIDTATSDTATASDLARVEIVLRALGVDSQELYTYDSLEPINNALALQNADHTASGYYAVPWVLLANLQGNLNLHDEEISALITVLQHNSAGGTFGYEWEGTQYPDPDTAATVLAALATLCDTNDSSIALCEEILTALEGMISESGSFGSANSDAMVIIGLLAIGENPYEFKHETSGKSVVDGLLSSVNEANNGFTFWGADNFMATEQGFRALVALSLYEGDAINIYDFSSREVVPGRQQSIDEQLPPEEDTEIAQITVTMTIKTDAVTWLEETEMQIAENGTVYDALIGAAEANGITVIGADQGYVSAMTKDGITLSEFDRGTNSGWLYKVNGEDAKIGLKDYVLSEGDVVLWYYVADWKESAGILGGYGSGYGGGGFGGGSSSSKPKEPEKTEEPEEVKPPAELEKPEVPKFSDTDNHWAKDGIDYVTSLGIMNGVVEGKFAPEEKLTRGMLVTMLYRLSGDEVTDESGFSNVADNAWYAESATWAKEKGITSGYGDGTFGANDEVTREQLVVFLIRYAELMGMNTEAEKADFEDSNDISDWAQNAINWAKAFGIVSGRDDGNFDPKGDATRGEIAVVFMRFCEMSR